MVNLKRNPKAMVLYVGSVLMATLIGQGCAKMGSVDQPSLKPRSLQVIEPGTAPAPVVPIPKTSFEPVLADRYQLKSLFEDIFGMTAGTVGTGNLFRDVQTNGSPCSPYEAHRTLDASGNMIVGNAMEAGCIPRSINRVNARVNPNPTVTRQALMSRTCSDLTANDTTLRVAMTKVASGGSIPEPSDQNLTAAYRLFYRNGPAPSSGVLQSLRLMFNPSAPTLNNWRSAIYTICVSSHWQVL